MKINIWVYLTAATLALAVSAQSSFAMGKSRSERLPNTATLNFSIYLTATCDPSSGKIGPVEIADGADPSLIVHIQRPSAVSHDNPDYMIDEDGTDLLTVQEKQRNLLVHLDGLKLSVRPNLTSQFLEIGEVDAQGLQASCAAGQVSEGRVYENSTVAIQSGVEVHMTRTVGACYNKWLGMQPDNTRDVTISVAFKNGKDERIFGGLKSSLPFYDSKTCKAWQSSWDPAQ